MDFLTEPLTGAAPAIAVYVLGARDFKDWLWVFPAGAKEKLLSKVREVTGLYGKE